MNQPLTGLHHVTAVTARAADNVRFYTQTLGLRLVKKTVNQDDVSAYHLFYGDEIGRPGTEVTFFDWPWTASRRHGSGTISEIGLRVPDAAALDWWKMRFDTLGIQHFDLSERNGRVSLAFMDAEEQRLALVADGDSAKVAGGVPWRDSVVPADVGIRGLNHISFVVHRIEQTQELLTGVMGFRPDGEYVSPDSGRVTVFATGDGGPGAELHVEAAPDLPRGSVGKGGVHHVAFRAPDDEAHRQWQRHLAEAGVAVTEVIDRFYFRSIYFREPGGVLFEIATDGPGFATDEDQAHLGERLSLPPFLEPHRSEIEAGLRPLPTAAMVAES